MPERVSPKTALRRILQTETLEEAKQIAHDSLHWADDFSAKAKCAGGENCPNGGEVVQSTACRWRETDTSEIIYYCPDCCPQCKRVLDV